MRALHSVLFWREAAGGLHNSSDVTSRKLPTMKTMIATLAFGVSIWGSALLAPTTAYAADASPRVRAHAQALFTRLQEHPTARVDIGGSVAALPAALEPELRAFLGESGLTLATGVLARADVDYRSAIARRLSATLGGRELMVALIKTGRDRRPQVLRALASAASLRADGVQRTALFAAISAAPHNEQSALLAGIATNRDAATRDYLLQRLASANASNDLTGVVTALGEFGAKPYWDGAAGEAERAQIALAVFSVLDKAATNAAARAAFVKTMLRVDAPNQSQLLAQAQTRLGAEKQLVDEWATLAQRVR
jgi:hypothetical protein